MSLTCSEWTRLQICNLPTWSLSRKASATPLLVFLLGILMLNRHFGSARRDETMDQPVNETWKRCSECAQLSIESLVELARIEFTAHSFPQESYYRHHASFDDLERSAGDGCGFCGLVLECFQRSICIDDEDPLIWPDEWDSGQLPSPPAGSNTMYAVAKSLHVSDIKLCVNATHLYHRQTIEEAQVFDEIMVQVGPLEVQSHDETEWSMPPLRLTMESPRGQPLLVSNLRVGRLQVDTDLGSRANYSLARQWLSDCRLLHESCLSEQLHELPTRVIDVGCSLDSPTVSLFVSQGLKADYVALSHCWGGAISPLLTTETMEPFQQSIQISTLPANFRDAVAITRNLGLRYLWIDSLCIQQDSKSDWDSESKMMGSVYRNSTVTISAMVSSGSKEGILKCGPPVAERHKSTSLPLSSRGCTSLPEVTVYRRDPAEDTFRALDMGCALTRRGWTLQEYMLSPRHILYGKDMLYWRCPQTFLSSDGLPPGNRTPGEAYASLSRVIYSDIMHQQPPASDISVLLSEYYELVSAYSARKLTYGSDKLPAFSGLAQRLQAAIGGDYIAGIWTTDFRRGLLWMADREFCRHASGPYRAPSWSWAVTDEEVLFRGYAESGSILEPSPSSAILIDYSVEPRIPGNPYGEIGAASLVLRALVKPLLRSSQVVYTTPTDPGMVGTASFDEPVGPDDAQSMHLTGLFQMRMESAEYMLSVVTKQGPKADWDPDLELVQDQEYWLLLIYTDDKVPEDPRWSNSEAVCLIIQSAGDDHPNETFKRVGFAKLRPPKLEWLKTMESRVLTLV
ncbi:uncharacterized protein PpBr36_10680 [Pyricularia pennisetigena]|uniref:uncharacterized protein n=1 Tax=Pyricularia pennisetigena TaxID=1578925 RepID=UPI00115072DD|nr:uncharacterized protein PpBr36_10680 [Pyricularia pennisetigena]TLS20828.1 hypothetical protein PpBr36_10680 [Pyricularia pennisetigena]